MAHLLITSGPTRQHLDPVRYLTNASSGQMGRELARATIERGHRVTIVSGPVEIDYPPGARVVNVVSTEQMMAAAEREFAECDGLIGAAAPCDYRPQVVAANKIAKDGRPLTLELIETEDIVATLAHHRRSDQWVVGFALETDDHRLRAIAKLERKHCDLIVSNSTAAISSPDNQVEIIDRDGQVVRAVSGTKSLVADVILDVIDQRLIWRGKSE